MEYIVIHSNINKLMNYHIECLKADEEAEKRKRDEEFRKQREEREQREKKWKEEHPNLSKYTYYTSDTYYSPYYGGYCRINFYEWSDIHSTPKTFDYYSPFYKFLDESGLFITEQQNSIIKPLNKCFITCVPGGKELIVAKTYEELTELYNTHKG